MTFLNDFMFGFFPCLYLIGKAKCETMTYSKRPELELGLLR